MYIPNIINLLMKRDGISKAEAENEILEAKQQMSDCNYDCDECENIMLDVLGLEMDYIFDIL